MSVYVSCLWFQIAFAIRVCAWCAKTVAGMVSVAIAAQVMCVSAAGLLKILRVLALAFLVFVVVYRFCGLGLSGRLRLACLGVLVVGCLSNAVRRGTWVPSLVP